MRIIHTADWHLGHRLGRIDRSDHLRQAVSRVLDLCRAERADVLLICGDLFHDVGRAETLRESVEHLTAAFRPFFATGGTVLAITGNHDKEHLAHVLQQVMKLAAPADTKPGDTLAPGRFYLFTGPTFFRLADRDESNEPNGPANPPVQFVMMPWPTPARYLDEQGQRFASTEERNRALRAAFTRRLNSILNHPSFDNTLHTVLAAHVITRGAQVRADGFTLNEADAVVLDDDELPAAAFDYVALGDCHRPQCLMGLNHVRYAGSIERLDLGEAGDDKGVVLVDLGPAGRRCDPQFLPLPATPIYRVRVDDPPTQIPGLADLHPDRETALVNLHVTYRPGRDNVREVLAELERIFPNWYDRRWEAAGGNADDDSDRATADANPCDDDPARVHDTVRAYLDARLAADDDDRAELLALAEALMADDDDKGEPGVDTAAAARGGEVPS